MKILVVDDSSTMRRIVTSSLQHIGFSDLVEAADGQDALDLYDASVALVIADWNMPRMDGVALAAALRARGETVPVLVVTARSTRDEILEAVQAGASGYLVKPFTPQVLREKIEALVGAAARG